jgi:aspartate racemase
MIAHGKRLGLLGGTSWESTIEYYRLINQRSAAILGGNSTVELLLWSFDFGEILDYKARSDGAKIAEMFSGAARSLAAMGADLLVICSNTGHQRAEELQAAAKIPIVHIADACGEAIRLRQFDRVGLLGTLDTMEGSFYREKLRKFGLEVIVPEKKTRDRVHEIAIDEISQGKRLDSSRIELLGIVDQLKLQGAQGVILGCTELPLLVSQTDTSMPLFDTLSLHVDEIIRRALD